MSCGYHVALLTDFRVRCYFRKGLLVNEHAMHFASPCVNQSVLFSAWGAEAANCVHMPGSHRLEEQLSRLMQSMPLDVSATSKSTTPLSSSLLQSSPSLGQSRPQAQRL